MADKGLAHHLVGDGNETFVVHVVERAERTGGGAGDAARRSEEAGMQCLPRK